MFIFKTDFQVLMNVIFTKWSFIANIWLIPRNNDEQDVDDGMIPANKEVLLRPSQGFT